MSREQIKQNYKEVHDLKTFRNRRDITRTKIKAKISNLLPLEDLVKIGKALNAVNSSLERLSTEIETKYSETILYEATDYKSKLEELSKVSDTDKTLTDIYGRRNTSFKKDIRSKINYSLINRDTKTKLRELLGPEDREDKRKIQIVDLISDVDSKLLTNSENIIPKSQSSHRK